MSRTELRDPDLFNSTMSFSTDRLSGMDDGGLEGEPDRLFLPEPHTESGWSNMLLISLTDMPVDRRLERRHLTEACSRSSLSLVNVSVSVSNSLAKSITDPRELSGLLVSGFGVTASVLEGSGYTRAARS
jgi:hypothetical protein